MWHEKLKEAGVSVHVIATGAGAGLQQELWGIPGSSAYLSGASFPYAMEETEELLGFKPEHFCSEEAAIDLASAAYMKAYRFGGKKPVGLGITASVASEKIHRGDHRLFACIITDEKVLTFHHVLTKGAGVHQRILDGHAVDDIGLFMLIDALGISQHTLEASFPLHYQNATEKAMARFLARPFFTRDGRRLDKLNAEGCALMSGAYNPPHQGHYGMADVFEKEQGKKVVFEITANPPHKDALSVQQLLQRAKLLQGRDRLFTWSMPFYLDKARAYPGVPVLMGADAMVRMLDPKWGKDVPTLLEEFRKLGTHIYVNGRTIDGKFVTRDDIITELHDKLSYGEWLQAASIIMPLNGRWEMSSTEIRNKLK